MESKADIGGAEGGIGWVVVFKDNVGDPFHFSGIYFSIISPCVCYWSCIHTR